MAENNQPDDILSWQQEQWHSGNRVSLETLLEKHARLLNEPNGLLDLIYNEVLMREDLGESPQEWEYLQRFPALTEHIARQFQVHRALQIDFAPEDEKVTADPGAAIDGQTIAGDAKTVEHATQQFPQIPGFRILSVAGRGGNGVAYRAIDNKLKRIVAIKLLDASRTAGTSRPGSLLREASAAAALVHPSIVPVLQVGEVGDSPFLVMEFIDGGSLAERLQSGPLPVTEAVALCQQVAEAIHYAHSKSIIHRDLKPGNILLDADRHPRVCDFGLARTLGADETMHLTGDVVGTPAYMPPEQARGERVDARADVYALGAILYETLSGRPPFQAATPWEILHQVLTNDILPLRQLNATLPRDLETICARCLEKDPARRYASADEVSQELNRFRSGQPIKARPLGPLPRLVKWIRRHPGMTSVIGIVAASLVTVAAVASLSQRRVSDALADTQDALQEAERQRDVALDAMNNLVYRVHDDLQKRTASVEARAEVLQSAIEGLQTIMEVTGDREDTRITLATALTRLGYILTQQGKNEEAEVRYLKSIEIADTFHSDIGQQQRAQNYSNIALFYVRAAKFDSVEEWANKTRVLAENLLQKDPDNLDLQNIAVQATTQLATAASVLKDPATALAIRQEAQLACANLYATHPGHTSIRDELVDLNLLLIQDCLTLARFDEADGYVQQCLKILEPQAPTSTEDVQIQRRYCSSLRFNGIVLFSRGDYQAAIESVQKAIESYSQLVEIEPNRPGFHLRLGTMHEVMADCWLALGNLDECERHARLQIQETETGIERGGPSYAIQRFAVAKGYFLLGGVLLRKNDLPAAADTFRSAASVLEPILDLYNTRDIHKTVHYTAELVAGVAGKEHTADQADVDAVMRTVSAWRALSQGDDSVFAAEEERMLADVQSAGRAEVKSMLTNFLGGCYALRYGILLKTADTGDARVQDAESRCIKTLLNTTDRDPLLHMRYPEFHELRSSPRFIQAFRGID